MTMIHAAIRIESQPSSHCLFLIPFLDRRLTRYALMLTNTYNENLNDNLELVCWFDGAYLTLVRVCRMPNLMFSGNVLLSFVCIEYDMNHIVVVVLGFKEWQSILLKSTGQCGECWEKKQSTIELPRDHSFERMTGVSELIQDELIQVAGS